MKIVKIDALGKEVPANFTGILEYGSGNRYWMKNGKIHREDGPAIIYLGGGVEWWLLGEPYSKEKWFNVLTPEQKENAFWSEELWK